MALKDRGVIKRAIVTPDKHFPLHDSKAINVLCKTIEIVKPDIYIDLGDVGEWENFSSSSKIAWKTGTSFGHKDAWSIGITPEYITVVWVGNADGEGRPGLTGTSIAAPIMFNVFNSR